MIADLVFFRKTIQPIQNVLVMNRKMQYVAPPSPPDLHAEDGIGLCSGGASAFLLTSKSASGPYGICAASNLRQPDAELRQRGVVLHEPGCRDLWRNPELPREMRWTSFLRRKIPVQSPWMFLPTAAPTSAESQRYFVRSCQNFLQTRIDGDRLILHQKSGGQIGSAGSFLVSHVECVRQRSPAS